MLPVNGHGVVYMSLKHIPMNRAVEIATPHVDHIGEFHTYEPGRYTHILNWQALHRHSLSNHTILKADDAEHFKNVLYYSLHLWGACIQYSITNFLSGQSR